MKRLKYIGISAASLFLSLFLLYYFESHHPDSNIKDFSDALWYLVVTITTVGYGDFYPVTALGKIIGLIFILSSLGLLGTLFGKISEYFFELNHKRKMGYSGTNFKNHAVIVGWNDFARSVIKQLLSSENRIAIVCDKMEDVDNIYNEFGKKDIFVLFSDYKNIENLDRVNITDSYITFVNVGADTDKLISVLNLKKLFPDVQYIVTLDDADLRETFEGLGVTFVLSKNEIASKLIASYIFEPDVAEYSSDLITSAQLEDDHDIQQYQVLESSKFHNKTCGEAFEYLKKNHNILLIGLAKNQNGSRKLMKLPDDDTKIELKDYMIMIMKGHKKDQLRDMFGINEGVLHEINHE